MRGRKSWRCFHCDMVFTNPLHAAEHFGGTPMALAACQIKGHENDLVDVIRSQESALAAYREEDSRITSAWRGMQAKHAERERKAEETGFDRGVQSMKALAKAQGADDRHMKVLTLTQPWATLVALLQKTIETRSWGTHYRGELAIHAAKGYTEDDRYITTTEPFVTGLGGLRPVDLPFGKVVAVVTLDNCYRFNANTRAIVVARSAKGELPPDEEAFGNYDEGRYGLLFTNIIPLKQPIPARGMQGLWNLPSDVEKLVREQMAA